LGAMAVVLSECVEAVQAVGHKAASVHLLRRLCYAAVDHRQGSPDGSGGCRLHEIRHLPSLQQLPRLHGSLEITACGFEPLTMSAQSVCFVLVLLAIHVLVELLGQFFAFQEQGASRWRRGSLGGG